VFSRYGLIIILLIAAFWRFYNYPSRWVLNQDQARDATIALYSIRSGSLPLLGSPSSAGPFNFGPLYDYTIILLTYLLPFVSGPWVGFTLLSLITVYLFYLIGVTLGSRSLGLILALISALSSELIFNAPDMLNTVVVAFGVTLTLLMSLKLVTTKRLIYSLLLGLAAGFTLNNHFQSLGITTLLALTPFFTPIPLKKKFLSFLLIGLGIVITFLPPLIFDLNHRFVWLQSVISYYTGGVNKFWAPTSWRRDLFTFWPQLFGSTLVGFPLLGWPFLITSALIPLTLLIKYRLPRPALLLGIYFITQVFLLRYYPGVRSREYLIAFQPLIIFFFGYSLFVIISKSKIVGTILLVIFSILSSITNLKYIHNQSQAALIFNLKTSIDAQAKLPIALYSDKSSNMVSLPVFYLLYRNNQISTNGTPVLACINCSYPEYKLITSQSLSPTQTYYLYQLPISATTNPLFFHLTPELIFSWLYINYP
jgi:hypothetical protein